MRHYKTIISLLFFLIASSVSLSSWGQASTQLSIHHLYQSARPLGMGDAFVATADDYNATLYNPAGLARIEVPQVNMSLDLAASADYQKFINDVNNAGKGDLTSDQKAINYDNVLQKYYGHDFGLRTGLLEGQMVRPGWGVSVIPADISVDIVIRQLVGPSVDLKAYADTTIAYGYGQDVKGVEGRLSWGITGKFVNRGFASKQILPLDLVSNSKIFDSSTLEEGYTVDGDVGLLYTPFLPSEGPLYGFHYAKPTFGAVVHNVADLGFTHSLHLLNKTTTEAPERLYRVLDLGTKFEFPSASIFGGRAEVDVRDIGHPNYSFRKGFHAGVEMDWQMFSWWKGSFRTGINQNYPTFGVSALFAIFKLDLVTYGEDIGSYDQPQQNRMYMLKANIDI